MQQQQQHDLPPIRQLVKRQTFAPLLQDTLQALQNPLCNPESHQFKNVAYTIKNCEFFRSHLPKHIDLNKFAELAKLYVHYETHETGSVLHYEKDEVKKFYIILDGTAAKMRSKTVSTDFDIRESLDARLSLNNPRSVPENLYPAVFSKGFLGTPRENNEVASPRASAVGYFLNPRLMLPLQQAEGQSTEPMTPKSPAGGTQNRHFSIDIQQKSDHVIDDITEEEEENGKSSARRAIVKIFNPTLSPPKNLKKITSAKLNISELQENVEKQKRRMNQRKSGFGPSLLKFEEDSCEPSIATHTLKDFEIRSTRCLDRKLTTTNCVKLGTYEAGDYFGEVFCSKHKQKENCMIITSSDVLHALTLDRDSYFNIIRELNADKDEKLELFTNLLPSFDACLLEEFSTYFTKKTFNHDEVIYSEREPSQNFYLLKSGAVKLLKDFQATEPNSPSSASIGSCSKKEICVVSIVKNQVFGEEVLVNKPLRHYTAVANSPNTVAYMMESSTIEKIKFKFGKFFEALKTQAEERLAWRSQKALEIFESQTGSRNSCSSLLTYTPKNSKSSKQSLSWADVSIPQKSKPVFHASSYQHFVDRSPTLPKIEPKKEIDEEQNEEETGGRLEKYKNAFSRAYIAPKLTVLQNHRKAASFKSNKNLTVKMNDPFEFNIRKELYCSSKKSYQSESSQSPTDKKIQRIQVKAKTTIPIKEVSPKIIITPMHPKNGSTIGTVSAFKEKLPQMINLNLNKSPRPSPRNFKLDFASLAQDKVDAILSITSRSKSAQKIFPEPIKV